MLNMCFLLLGAPLLGIGAIGAVAQTMDVAPQLLGEFPLCEGSAAVWPGGGVLLIGDNEVRETLYEFPLKGGLLDPSQSVEHSLGDQVEISDIEAIAALQGDEIVVFGSHSRNSRCRARRNRRRFLRGKLTVDGFVANRDGVVTMSSRISCETLFGQISKDKPLLASVCERLDAVEQEAERIWGSAGSDDYKAEACEKAQPFNAEGAMAISDGAVEEVWVGLRAPLLPAASVGGANDLAILLRMQGLDEYAFDEAALVDLGGAGIRELTVSNGWVIGIAGPPQDSGVDFRLWMFPIDQLEAEAIIKPTVLRSPGLPSGAEGLAIVDSTAQVVIDGDQGDGRCIERSKYLPLPLPR